MTLRQIVHLSVAGRAVRVRLTNEFGSTPLTIGAAHVARRADGGPGTAVDPAADRTLRFGGRTATTLAAGAQVWSDPVALATEAGGDLVVSLCLPQRTPGSTIHSSAFQHGWVAAGNVAGKPDITPTQTITNRRFPVRRLGRPAAQPGGFGAGHVRGPRSRTAPTPGSTPTTGGPTCWPSGYAATASWPPPPRAEHAGIGGNRLLRDPNPAAGLPAESYAAYFGRAGSGASTATCCASRAPAPWWCCSASTTSVTHHRARRRGGHGRRTHRRSPAVDPLRARPRPPGPGRDDPAVRG
ncbi:hypothetical protein [Streptomyces sp. KL116D]|uniref:hypothetical protein n=1 Tax=Streptomyces sp. KL116D TaxID=3045152 RepID=UPI0035561101